MILVLSDVVSILLMEWTSKFIGMLEPATTKHTIAVYQDDSTLVEGYVGTN